jgi:hypothetical protein
MLKFLMKNVVLSILTTISCASQIMSGAAAHITVACAEPLHTKLKHQGNSTLQGIKFPILT